MNKHTILIVDDMPENIDLLKGVLMPLYDITVATNGRLALRLAELEPRPDLILLDVMMPGMDGHEVCRRLKGNEATRPIPVIFVTSMDEVDNVARGFELGAADYIIKPVDAPVVLARVRAHLSLNDERLHLNDLVRDRTRELESMHMELILQMGRAAEFRDNETSAHTMRMAKYSSLLARHVGMSEKQADMMHYASMLHDVGKIGIPDYVLLKPGKLTEEEFSIMKRHSEIGGDIISKHNSELLNTARTIALSHHEKWNGKGYPLGLKGRDISLEGRISALADVFDALTSQRPYKQPWSVDDALAFIKSEVGEHFDPELALLFISLEPELRRIKDAYQDNEGLYAMEGANVQDLDKLARGL